MATAFSLHLRDHHTNSFKHFKEQKLAELKPSVLQN